DPALVAAMDRLEAALSVVAPPGLAAAARSAGCPPDGIRALERAGRIGVVETDLAWSAARRDATGTSRKYVLAILEDLDRRGIRRRTVAGHVPGP
ncbi:MAG: SelB C-terminal domain-containing protein, partial [Chloroflexota bacterium]